MSDPIAALHARYRASLPEKRAELLAALSHWRDDPGAEAGIAALYLLTHKLAGSAGAYGFDALAALARTADQLLQPHARGGVPMGSQQIAPVDAAIQALCDALASA